MDRATIIRRLKRHAGGQDADFVTRRQIADMFGLKKPDSANKYVRGLKCISGRYFEITEVANRIVQYSGVREG